MLYIVPTPVGNLEDITLRAIRILKEVDFILAEDTRTSGILLKHLNISKPVSSFHIFNEHKRLAAIVAQLKEGKQAALVSDAGTPGISDPGFLLVRALVEEQVPVTCLPGPTAFVPALVVSGLPTDKFWFEGFLPQKKGRQTRIKHILTIPATVVLYESPHRISRLLTELVEWNAGDRKISISREISKHFEENLRGTVLELKHHFELHPPKGEFVVCLEGTG